MLDNSLEFGDFLTFYYGGNDKFYVKIYGKNGCLKEPKAPTRDIHRAISHSQENRTVEHSKFLWTCKCTSRVGVVTANRAPLLLLL